MKHETKFMKSMKKLLELRDKYWHLFRDGDLPDTLFDDTLGKTTEDSIDALVKLRVVNPKKVITLLKRGVINPKKLLALTVHTLIDDYGFTTKQAATVLRLSNNSVSMTLNWHKHRHEYAFIKR